MSASPEQHTLEAGAVIAAELVAATLGQHTRPELYVGLPAVGYQFQQLGESVRAAVVSLGRLFAQTRDDYEVTK